MDYCFWINARRTALLHLIIGVIISRVSVAQNSPFSLAIAGEHCANQSSHLPGLSSVRDGSLVDELEVHKSTWIDARIKRGHWQWYSSDMIIHTNQGCFGINENSSFLNKFNQTSSDSSQIECINYCKNNDYFYSGLSAQSGALVCYCGNEVPLEGAAEDNKCREKCNGGNSICGHTDYSRIITSQASGSDLPWEIDGENNSDRWCAFLKYIGATRNSVYSFKPMLARSDCQTEKKALCVTNNRVYTVSKEVMSWFEAQNFCYTTGTNHDMNTVSLSEVIATNLLEVSVTDFKVEYWTQLSSLHLSSPVAENFGNLPWEEGNPHVLNGQTCIRALRRVDGIKLISAPCGEENIFICIHSNPANPSGMGIASTRRKSSVGWVLGGIFVVLCCGLSIAVYILIKRRLKSSPNGRPSTEDDGNQGEENAAHVYDEIPDNRMAANSGEASHEYENVNARTHNKSPQNMVAGIQANGQTANARSQHNDRHYVNMEAARNLNEQQSDQLNRQASSPTQPQRQESKQGDAGGANVYEGLADVPEEIPNAYESIGVRTTHE